MDRRDALTRFALGGVAAASFGAAGFGSGIVTQAKGQALDSLDPENTLMMVVGLDYPSDDPAAQPARTGQVVIQLLPDVAPNHVARIKQLVADEFYDNVVFHRVIEGFMAQTGDPGGDGTGGSSYGTIGAEFSNLPFERGVVGMARARHPDSANSQFFIMFDRAPSLDGEYTVFGRVADGMAVVDEIKRGPRNRNGVVDAPRDRMVQVRLASEL